MLHYCRLAPITDIAKYFRRAKAKQGIDDTIIKLSTNQAKINEAVDSMSVGILAEVNSLKARVEEVNKACGPKIYVMNNTTGIVHRVLTTISDAGAGGVAHCGFRYAFVPKTFFDDLPSSAIKKELCGACFKVLRAAR